MTKEYLITVDFDECTFVAHLASGDVSLRRPDGAEMNEINALYVEANIALHEWLEVGDSNDPARHREHPHPHRSAFAKIVAMLSDSAELDPDKLYSSFDDPRIFSTMLSLWVPCPIEELPVALPSHLMQFQGIEDGDG